MSTRTPSKRARPPPSPSSSPDPITARVKVGLSPFKVPSPRASSSVRKRAVAAAAAAATPTKKRKEAAVQVTPMKAIGREAGGGRKEVGVSPWRIKVMVEAQRDGEGAEEGERGEVVFGFGEGARGGNAGRGRPRGRVVRTVTVPLKGDSPAKRKAVRKATPARKRGAPAARRDVAVEEKSAAAPAETPTTTATRRIQNIRSLVAAAGRNAVVEPTLAAMRSRRSLLPPSSSAGVLGSSGKEARAASVVTDDDDASVSGRSALSWVNPNSLISPESASKSRVDKSSSPSVRKEAAFQGRDSFVVSEGGSLDLPDFRSSLPPSSDSYFGEEERDEEDMTEEEALADVSIASAWHRPTTTFEETVGGGESTYVSTGNSHIAMGRGGGMERGGVLLGDKSAGVATSYEGKRMGREEDGAGTQPEASMLLEDIAQPVEMEFTYIQGGVSYTPLKPREPEKQSPVFDTSVGAETFYGLPQDGDKGKGKEVDCDTSVVTKEQSHYSSSPPPAPKAHMAKRLPSPSTSKITPMMPQKRQGDEGDAAGAPPPVRVERDTPNLSRVRDASEMMSDALEVEADMVMEGEEFGDGFDDAVPLTPESVERPVPLADASMEEAGTGILSPPATSAPAAPSSPRRARGESAGRGAEAWEEQWEKERRENVQRAGEVGAVVIEDSTTVVDGEIPKPAHTSSSSSLREDMRRTKPPIDDDLLSTLTTTLPTPSGLVWKREHYAHLSAVLRSSSTPNDVGEGRFEVKLDRPERLLNREVIRRLRVDGEGFLRLTGRECAGVERFLRRERGKGREWGVGEVVRRVAGLRIAEVRRRWLGHRRVEV